MRSTMTVSYRWPLFRSSSSIDRYSIRDSPALGSTHEVVPTRPSSPCARLDQKPFQPPAYCLSAAVGCMPSKLVDHVLIATQPAVPHQARAAALLTPEPPRGACSTT